MESFDERYWNLQKYLTPSTMVQKDYIRSFAKVYFPCEIE